MIPLPVFLVAVFYGSYGSVSLVLYQFEMADPCPTIFCYKLFFSVTLIISSFLRKMKVLLLVSNFYYK